MTQYEKTTLKAVEILQKDNTKSYSSAWKEAASIIIQNINSRNKPCPGCAFVALCQLGVVKGVSANENFTEYNGVNMNYMRDALDLISKDRTLIKSKSKLWSKIPNTSDSIASRLDSLVALYKNNMLK